MTREEALREWHQKTLVGFLSEVNALVGRKEKYIDPDFSREPTSGKPLYERVRAHREYLVAGFPKQAAQLPPMKYVFPRGMGESLSRDELRRLRSEIETALRCLMESV